MGFPQEIGTQDDKMKVDSDFDTPSTQHKNDFSQIIFVLL